MNVYLTILSEDTLIIQSLILNNHRVHPKHASSLREMNNTPMQSHSSNNNFSFFPHVITENHVFTILSY